MKWFICIMMLSVSCVAKPQGVFHIRDDKPVSFNFELINNIILIPLTINGVPFSFLLDTGVKETILFANAEDSLYLNNQNKMTFQGMGVKDGVDGILSTDNVVEVGDVAVDSLHWIYVVQGNELDISTDVGAAINGILGSKFFGSFAVLVNYQKQRITLFPPGYDYQKSVRKYTDLPLMIENGRPYITADMLIDTAWVRGKMMMDTGNTSPLMLFDFLLPDFQIKKPYIEEYIGRGFNGDVYGKRNRIRKAMLGGFTLDYPIVAYPDSNALFMTRIAKNRIGSVGNHVLQRFYVLIDYSKKAIYLRKNRKFGKPFLLNMAGIDVRHNGMIWRKELVKTALPKKEENQMKAEKGTTIRFNDDAFQYAFVLQPAYRISGVRKGSPAEKSGIRPGDMLLKVNGKSAGRLTLSKIMEAMQSRPGETIRLRLQRNEEQYDTRFVLVDPIPF